MRIEFVGWLIGYWLIGYWWTSYWLLVDWLLSTDPSRSGLTSEAITKRRHKVSRSQKYFLCFFVELSDYLRLGCYTKAHKEGTNLHKAKSIFFVFLLNFRII